MSSVINDVITSCSQERKATIYEELIVSSKLMNNVRMTVQCTCVRVCVCVCVCVLVYICVCIYEYQICSLFSLIEKGKRF